MTHSVPRIEDDRLLRGKGRFVEDLNFDGQAFAYMLRSPHAHGRIRSINTEEASAHPGVVAIITGSDVSEAGLGPMPCRTSVTSRDGSPMRAPERPLLASEMVR
ncbi:MAG TPA: xanthine dehydrogenase family protein molybdopterin-binding subunit, partial [Gammaproteobacteria bacterium]|nr:xanthine dehydrogenase family protein molybdopterin-binding subunit [Gammaproteobacteria bacterium]